MRTLDEAIDRLAARGDGLAFRHRTEFRSFPVTGAEAAQRALRLAAVLRSRGVGRGDRVIIRGPNGPDWGLALLAVLRLGAVAVPLDMRASLAFTRVIAERTGARAAVLSRFGAPGPADLPTVLLEDFDALVAAECGPDPEAPGLDPDDTAQILFTSGTTGSPKGVVLTHRNVTANVAALSRLIDLGPDDRFLSLLPLSHMFEQTVGFFMPIVNGPVVVYVDALKPSAIRRAFAEEHITLAVMVPRILKGLMLGIRREAEGGVRGALFNTAWALAGALPLGLRRLLFGTVHRRLGGRVRFLFSGGAPLEPDVEGFWERLGFPIIQGWGLTETSPVLTCARPGARRMGAVGRFLDDVEHRIEENGEIVVRGPSVFGGYLEDPETTAAVLDDDGWFRTGDLGELRDGFLFLKGRSKDLIKTPGGLNVYPEDVEGALRAVDGVRDACVFGMKGDRGEEVAAALLAEPGRSLDPRVVAAAANERLEDGRGVARCFVWPDDDFPRTPTLKVRKFQVKQAVEEGAVETGDVPGNAPEDPVVGAIAKLARREAAEIADDDRLGPDLGLDSLDLVDLVSTLEERLRTDLDEGSVAPETTVAELRALLGERKGVSDEGLARWPFTAPAGAARWLFRHLVLFPLFRSRVDLEVRGAEHLEGLAGPVILAPNHLSHLDLPAILLALPKDRRRITAPAAWKEWFEPPGAGLLKRLGLESLRALMLLGLPMIPVAQSRAYRRSMRNIGSMLDRGWSLVFFPEGERSLDGVRKPFRAGIGIVAGPMRATVIPVRLEHFHELMPRGRFFPRKGTGRVTFGEPLRFPADADPAVVARRVGQAVDALAAE